MKGIVDFIDQHGTTQVKDFEGIADADTLHTSRHELIDLGCIMYVGADTESGYKITEKGKKIVHILRDDTYCFGLITSMQQGSSGGTISLLQMRLEIL